MIEESDTETIMKIDNEELENMYIDIFEEFKKKYELMQQRLKEAHEKEPTVQLIYRNGARETFSLYTEPQHRNDIVDIKFNFPIENIDKWITIFEKSIK